MKEIVLFSGGLDGTVLLADRVREGCEAVALHIRYGSAHEHAESRAAQEICTSFAVPLKSIDLPLGVWGFKSALLVGGPAIPDEPYSADSLASTVVPFRNGIMIAVAAGFAQSVGTERVSIAVHTGDHPVYPDCTPGFLNAMSGAVMFGTGRHVRLVAPFARLRKWEIVKKGAELNAPMQLSYSCYRGAELKHCGKCGTCRERRGAFVRAGVEDLTEYECECNSI